MKKNILISARRALFKTGLKLKKHSPEILVAAGVIGTVASTVMACKATTKLSGILEESKEEINKIHEYVETEGYSEKYTEEDNKKDLTIVYVQTGVKLIKLYAPAVLLGALSLTSIVASNRILHKRNVAIAAAYTAVDKGFKEYRNNVVERFGPDLDKELKYNIKAKEVDKIVVNEDGSESTVKEIVQVASVMPSEYAKFFDEYCTGWTKNAELNKSFLLQQQKSAQRILEADGYLPLNTVYSMLGIPKTRQGQYIGWWYEVGKLVDFGIFDVHNEQKRDFVNGYERSILLDFNVDGNILDYI